MQKKIGIFKLNNNRLLRIVGTQSIITTVQTKSEPNPITLLYLELKLNMKKLNLILITVLTVFSKNIKAQDNCPQSITRTTLTLPSYGHKNSDTIVFFTLTYADLNIHYEF